MNSEGIGLLYTVITASTQLNLHSGFFCIKNSFFMEQEGGGVRWGWGSRTDSALPHVTILPLCEYLL